MVPVTQSATNERPAVFYMACPSVGGGERPCFRLLCCKKCNLKMKHNAESDEISAVSGGY